MFREALESRLRVIEEEITRLLRLSAEAGAPGEQDDYLRLAQDLQREARELRMEINRQTRPQPAVTNESNPKNSFFISR